SRGPLTVGSELALLDIGHSRSVTVTRMIRVGSISKAFGRVQAVRGISFEVPKGQVVGLLGANGAGKTTTLRMVTGFLPPDEGAITVEGFDTVRQSEQARRSVGYLPEA